jgi:succinate dehydrogenase / fumarate reductase iron-sulfur subunit
MFLFCIQKTIYQLKGEESMFDESKAYLKIKRQTSPEDKPYWESFSLNYKDDDTILSLLIQLENPSGNSSPVHHECNCKEEMCGTCTLRINGVPRLSCSTRITDLPKSLPKKPIVLEPLEKFGVIKDLTVDRSRISSSLTRVKKWVETDNLFGSKVNYQPKIQREIYSYAKCINCGSCYDACPRTNKLENHYIGPAAIAHVITMNDHPLGKESSNERLKAISGKDGLPKCGKAMICDKVCPKKVPLVRSITRANREVISKILH